jgi:transposase InsO family protein
MRWGARMTTELVSRALANGYDHAPMESFWGILKNELVSHRRYETRNRRGVRSTIGSGDIHGWGTPAAFAQH